MAEINWSTVGDNLATLLKWAYWIVGIIIVYTISHVLYTRFDKQVAAVLVFLASMMAMYYYYVKWFIVGQDLPIQQTVCPDFMTRVGTIGSDETLQSVCVDYTGNYPAFKTTVRGSEPAVTTSLSKYGSVSNTGAGASYVITPNESAKDTSVYCNALKNAGISHISLCTST